MACRTDCVQRGENVVLIQKGGVISHTGFLLVDSPSLEEKIADCNFQWWRGLLLGWQRSKTKLLIVLKVSVSLIFKFWGGKKTLKGNNICNISSDSQFIRKARGVQMINSHQTRFKAVSLHIVWVAPFSISAIISRPLTLCSCLPSGISWLHFSSPSELHPQFLCAVYFLWQFL